MELNPGPGERRIPCPLCGKGTIRKAPDTAALKCSRLKWEHDGFSGGNCTFTTRDFTPFAYTPPGDRSR